MKKILLIISLVCFNIAVTHAQAWKLVGNTATNSSINFVGTKDTVPLIFRVNNQRSGYLTGDSNKAHTIFGYLALSTNTGSRNTAIGYQSIFSNTIGVNNTGLGFRSLYLNTSGSRNTAVGYEALNKNTSGGYNTAIGVDALQYNTSGSYNTATGLFSLALNTTGIENTANGANALESNTTGSYNTATGRFALRSNTTGYSNIAIGASALYSNAIKSNLVAIGDSALYNNGNNATFTYHSTNNTAVGSKALFSNTTGYGTTATGFKSLFLNTTGYSNTASGAYALYSNINGHSNSASGYRALYNNISGNYNTAAGAYSLEDNQSGIGNTASGSYSLKSNISGYSNTASGYYALYSNTTGRGNTGTGDSALYNNTTGRGNTALGWKAMYGNTTGYVNIAVGDSALYTNTTGYNNTAMGLKALNMNTSGYGNIGIGGFALNKNTTGLYNTAIGTEALYENTNGSQNTAVGWKAGIVGNYDNTVCLGYDVAASASNQVRIGNTLTNSIGGFVGWTDISDGRVKKNIKSDVPGLAFINKLTPVIYNLDLDAINNIIKPGTGKTENSEEASILANELSAKKIKAEKNFTGFIAQDVEKAAKELNYDFSGVDAAKNEHDLYGLRYASFVVPLVKAVQELDQNQKNDVIKQNTAIEALQKENTALKERLEKLEAMMNAQQSIAGSKYQCINGGSLEQNIPNPFKNVTTIYYTLPAQYSTAKIIITSNKGEVIKEINVSGNGRKSVQVNLSSFAAGVYNYSLYAGNNRIASQQMVLVK